MDFPKSAALWKVPLCLTEHWWGLAHLPQPGQQIRFLSYCNTHHFFSVLCSVLLNFPQHFQTTSKMLPGMSKHFSLSRALPNVCRDLFFAISQDEHGWKSGYNHFTLTYQPLYFLEDIRLFAYLLCEARSKTFFHSIPVEINTDETKGD